MSKVLRRSDRIRDKRVLEQEAVITLEERVFHHPFLWMEIAQWDIDAFRQLSKITTAMSKKRHSTVDDFAAYRKDMVKKMLYVDSSSICSNTGEGGFAYAVTVLRRGCRENFNPFGPKHYHSCRQTLVLTFRDLQISEYDKLEGGLELRFATAPQYKWQQPTPSQREVIQKAVEVYRTNPFAEFDFSKLFN